MTGIILRYSAALWLILSALIAAAGGIGRAFPALALRVTTAAYEADMDMRTGVNLTTLRQPEAPQRPTDPYVVSMVGSPDAMHFRLITTQTGQERLLGPYPVPATSSAPLFWLGDRLWLVTLSADGQQTILRGLDSAEPEAGEILYPFDFPTARNLSTSDWRWLALESSPDSRGFVDVALVDMQDGTLIRIPNTPFMRWEISGEGIFFALFQDASTPTGQTTMQWFDPQTGRTLTSTAALARVQVSWSPQGRYALLTRASTDDPERYSLILVDLESFQERLLLEGTEQSWLYWSPDDAVLLVEMRSRPQHRLLVFESSGGDPHDLGLLPADGRLFDALSPAGRYALYDQPQGTDVMLRRIDLQSGARQRLGSFPKNIEALRWLATLE